MQGISIKAFGEVRAELEINSLTRVFLDGGEYKIQINSPMVRGNRPSAFDLELREQTKNKAISRAKRVLSSHGIALVDKMGGRGAFFAKLLCKVS